LMEGMLPEYALDQRVRQPAGAAIPTAAPTNTYPCADGKWLCIAGNSDLIFARLMVAIGRPELASDPLYVTNADRCARRDALDEAIAAWTRRLPGKQAHERLEAADVPCSRLYDIADLAADPHLLARKAILSVDDPLLGRTLHPGPAIRLDGDPPEAAVGYRPGRRRPHRLRAADAARLAGWFRPCLTRFQSLLTKHPLASGVDAGHHKSIGAARDLACGPAWRTGWVHRRPDRGHRSE
ncbi:MAG: CoA transferase, partial [Pseudomonadota bacterium]|nr:CoA transferase [Pseudomonadota bacterium]